MLPYYQAYHCLATLLEDSNLKVSMCEQRASGCTVYKQLCSNITYWDFIITCFSNSLMQLHHRLKPGEVMTFNNRRVLHGRNEFSLRGGQRHLQVGMVTVTETIDQVFSTGACPVWGSACWL